MYRNNQDGTFSDVAVARGTAFSENGMAQAGMGAAAGDFDADGRLDLFKTHFADDIPALFRALGGGRFEEVAMAAGLGGQNRYVEWGAGIVGSRQRRLAGPALRHRQRLEQVKPAVHVVVGGGERPCPPAPCRTRWTPMPRVDRDVA